MTTITPVASPLTTTLCCKKKQDKEKLQASLGRPVELAEAVAASGLSRKRYNGVMVDGMAARQRLVVSNLALVVSLAGKYKRSNLERCMEVGFGFVQEPYFFFTFTFFFLLFLGTCDNPACCVLRAACCGVKGGLIELYTSNTNANN